MGCRHDLKCGRRRLGGHGLRLLRDQLIHIAMEWVPERGTSIRGRPSKTWRNTFKDLAEMEITWNDAKQLRMIVPDGDNSSPDVPKGTGGTESKSKAVENRRN